MSGVDGFGTQIRRGDAGTPEVFTSIANVTDVSGPGLKRDTYDVTSHDSPEQWEEIIAGIKRSGEVSLDINYDPNIHDSLVTDMDDRVARNYQLGFPTDPPRLWTFKAWLTGLEPSAPHDDKLAASATFKLTGKPTLS